MIIPPLPIFPLCLLALPAWFYHCIVVFYPCLFVCNRTYHRGTENSSSFCLEKSPGRKYFSSVFEFSVGWWGIILRTSWNETPVSYPLRHSNSSLVTPRECRLSPRLRAMSLRESQLSSRLIALSLGESWLSSGVIRDEIECLQGTQSLSVSIHSSLTPYL